MIDKVEVGKKYRLVNEDGYVSDPTHGWYNRKLLTNADIFDQNVCVVIQRVHNKYGVVNGEVVISPAQYHLFELVEKNETDFKESKTITSETEVTTTTTYGELARLYYVMGSVNGKIRGKDVWIVIGDMLDGLNRSIYFGNEPNHPAIDYASIQEKWESLLFKSEEQQEKELAIKEKRAVIAKLEKEIKELEGK